MKNIAIIAPSGNVDNAEKLVHCKAFLENLDMKVKIFPSALKTFRYMAGNDEERLNDLHNAYLDPDIDTIICTRGGYGAIRLLDKIDYNIISKNPKKFIGSSDITALLVSIYKQTGQITYHAKMALNGVSQMDKDEFLTYKNAVENNLYNPPCKFTQNAILWGGNLATIVSLFGSPLETYVPNEDIILFIEDINEPEYKIDRMLTQILRNKPLAEKIKGVIFGEFISDNTEKFLQEILKEFAQSLGVPYGFDPKITHGMANTIVPVGLKLGANN